MGLFSKKHRKQDRPAGTPAAVLNPEPPSPKEVLPPASDSAPASDPVKELERLESMRDRGMLSPEDFALEKRKIQASQSFRRI